MKFRFDRKDDINKRDTFVQSAPLLKPSPDMVHLQPFIMIRTS